MYPECPVHGCAEVTGSRSRDRHFRTTSTGQSFERNRHMYGKWRAIGLAVTAVFAVTQVTTACGGSSSAAGVAGGGNPSSSSAAAGGQSALAYSQCMRAHGIKDFPDPGSDGGIS